MDKLNKLTHAGLSYFDGNQEYFESAKWEKSPLGARKTWTQPAISFVSLLATLPHPAAVFWGPELSQVGNLSWGHASETYKDLGKGAKDLYPGEGHDLLKRCMLGRTITAGTSCFLTRTPEYGKESHILLSPVLGEDNKRAGVFAQLLANARRDPEETHALYLPGGDDDENEYSRKENVDEANTPIGTSPERKEDGKQEDGSPAMALESVATKEDDEEYFRQKRKEGKNEDGPEPEDENSGGHVNEKPSKKPYFIQDGQKLDLKQNHLFRKFAQMLPTGLAILDQEAEALFVNDKFFELTSNKSHKSFRAWPESIHPDDYDRVMEEYREAFSKREGVQTEFRCLIGEKPDPWRMFLMQPLSEDQDNTGYIVAVVNITDLKAAEMSQRKAAEEARNRKEQQERFVDMISHEIRNPLSAILHSSEEIRDYVKELGNHKSDLARNLMDATDTILLCVAHQSSLVDEILQFSKLDAAMLTLAPSVAQPKYDLAETLKLFQPELRAKNIGFEYAMDVSFDELKVGYVLADLKRMKQVLVNLMTNAIKFTAKAKGERRITVGMGASAEKPDSYPPSVCFFDDSMTPTVDVTLSSEWGKGETLYLMVAVKDTGIGIDEEGQQKLFERFRQATPKTQEKYGGSGLGLFISRKLCQLHGGDIGVSSKAGDGSTFGFYFRVRRCPPPNKDGGGESEEDEDDMTLAQHATADVEARSRASSLAKSNKGDEFNQPHMKDEEVPDLEKVNSKHIPDSLINPETKLIPEAHPGVSSDNRMETTAAIADKISSPERKTANLVKEQEESKAKDNGRETTQAMPTREKAPGLPRKNQNSVLLAEDNIINQKVLTRQLKSRGYEVTPANNGKEAVAAVENNISKTQDGKAREKGPFDVILMDQEMPYLTGNAATKAIRSIEREKNAEPMPILGVSANVREEQKREMIEAGMNDVITKPFKVDELVTRIKGLIERWD